MKQYLIELAEAFDDAHPEAKLESLKAYHDALYDGDNSVYDDNTVLCLI